MSSLAAAYDDGIGIRKDDKAASYWYEKAALEGDAAAQFITGRRYETGTGRKKDLLKAIKFFRLAAEQSHRGQL